MKCKKLWVKQNEPTLTVPKTGFPSNATLYVCVYVCGIESKSYELLLEKQMIQVSTALN